MCRPIFDRGTETQLGGSDQAVWSKVKAQESRLKAAGTEPWMMIGM